MVFTMTLLFVLLKALDIYHVIRDLPSVEATKCVCHFLFQLSPFKQQFRFSMPALHSDLLGRLVLLTGSAAAVVSRSSTLKQIVKTMNASGVLEPGDGPLGGGLLKQQHRGARVRQRLFSEGPGGQKVEEGCVRPTVSFDG